MEKEERCSEAVFVTQTRQKGPQEHACLGRVFRLFHSFSFSALILLCLIDTSGL